MLEQDAYRTPLPREARTYELLNVAAEAGQRYVTNLFRFDEMAGKIQEIIDAGREIPYADVEAAGAAPDQTYRRLVEQVRTLYRSDDLTRLLEPGELESLALPGESYQLAFTPDLLDSIYRRGGENLLPDRADLLSGTAGDQAAMSIWMAMAAGGFPSGRIYYHPNTPPPGTQRASEARAHFFLPRRFQDPFGHNTSHHLRRPRPADCGDAGTRCDNVSPPPTTTACCNRRW